MSIGMPSFPKDVSDLSLIKLYPFFLARVCLIGKRASEFFNTYLCFALNSAEKLEVFSDEV
jgi:hypothetical protein